MEKKYLLLLPILLMIFSLGFVSSTYYNSLDTDLKAYYSFDTDYSDDFSSYDLSLWVGVGSEGQAGVPIVEGFMNNAVNFTRYDGGGDPYWVYLSILETPYMGNLSSETICFWIQYNNTIGDFIPFGRVEPDVHHYFYTNVADGYSGVSGGAGSTGVIDEHNIMNTDWHFVCFGGSSEQLFIYVDGNYVVNTSDALLGNSNPTFWVGSYGGYSSKSLQGRLDELGFWSRELSKAEMDILYNSGSGFSYFQSEPTQTSSSGAILNYDYLINGEEEPTPTITGDVVTEVKPSFSLSNFFNNIINWFRNLFK